MFLSFRADDGAGSDRTPFGDFWFSPVPYRGGAASVTPDLAMQLTAVLACVRLLAGEIAMLPFRLARLADDGRKTIVRNHWLYTLMARRPNAYQNPFEYREMSQAHVELRGNGFSQIIGNRAGEVTDLLPIHPDRVSVEVIADDNWRYRVKNRDGSVTILARQEVFHLRPLMLSKDGITGLNPIAASRESIALGLAAQSYGARFFDNDAKPGGGWIEHPTNFKDVEQKRMFRESWQDQQGGRNRGKTAVLEYGMKYHELGLNNDDAQFLETRKLQVNEIARLFGVPPHLIGDLDRSTNNNIEQQSLDYIMHALTPRLVRWEQALKYTFLAGTPDEDLDIEFDVTELMRGDMAARSAFYGASILDGWGTRNEARVMEGRDPLPGLDVPLIPLNMVEEGADPPQRGVNPAGGSKRKMPAPNTPKGRLDALAMAAAERLARRELGMVQTHVGNGIAQAYGEFAPVIAAALGVNVDVARSYCRSQLELVQSDGRMDVEHFAEIARAKLARLALTGEPDADL